MHDKRYLDIDYNYKGKNLSSIILDIENQILQNMINYFISKNVNILTLENDGLNIYTDKNSKHFSINELQLNIYKKLGINIKLAFKIIEDKFPEFGIRCNTNNIKNKKIIENKLKLYIMITVLKRIILSVTFVGSVICKLKIIKLFLCISLME